MVGIPPVTPRNLATTHHSLPTILYTRCQNPIPSYSKAPWGLSVLLQVTGIFTGNTISPGLPSRQLSDRYTIRAGRNLPDKEFRYLDRYRSSTGQASVRIHRLATRHGPVFLVNSRFSLVSAAVQARGASPVTLWAPLIPKLRGYFADFP